MRDARESRKPERDERLQTREEKVMNVSEQFVGWARGRDGGSVSLEVFDAEGVFTGRVVVLTCGQSYDLLPGETLVRADIITGDQFFTGGTVRLVQRGGELILRHEQPGGAEVDDDLTADPEDARADEIIERAARDTQDGEDD